MTITYADRPWIKNYDEGVPASLAPYPDQPVHVFLEESARKYPDHPAIITSVRLPLFGRQYATLTYAEFDDLADRLAAGLAAMGVRKGDRVAIMMPNCAQFVIAFYAITKVGGIVVGVNPLFPPPKIASQVADSGAETVICLTMSYNDVKKAQPETALRHVIVANIKEYFPPLGKTLFTLAVEKKTGHYVEALSEGDLWFQDVIAQHSAAERPQVAVSGDDTAIFQYTGGTTGVPKAAKSTHKTLAANVVQMRAWSMGASEEAVEKSLAAIPLYHIFGLQTVMNFSTSAAATMIMVPNARDIDDLLDTIHTFKPTIFMGVPALYNAVNYHPDVIAGKVDVGSIKFCFSGSAPLAPETKRRFEEISGGTVMEGFGMSEAPTATHCNPLNGVNKTGSIGMPFPDNECRIVSLDDEVTDVPVGEIGELVMRGPVMMSGYHNMPTETANAIRDGWLYTGDIARMDEEGYFYIVDRKKDMVLIGGFNVYPVNIDKVLMEHPAIQEAAVAGIPHPDPEKKGQEALKAWIVVAPGQQVTAEEIIQYCKERLAPYEVPRRIAFLDELPKTTVGKVLRRELILMEADEPGG
jgi:long-chain acyl-CoA synthetase